MNKRSPLKIIFMGTPDFAVPSLQLLDESPHKIQAVVTVPDKPQGRGRSVRLSAVKDAAIKLELPVIQPQSLDDIGFIEELTAYQPDVIVVVAFQILPKEVFLIPKFGAFNLHASLLPKYRGAAPIHWALLNGDTETGVSTFFLKSRVDTGNIISQKKIPIAPEDNLQSLYEKLSVLGAKLVMQTVDQIAEGVADAIEQDDTFATPAPKVTTETQLLDFKEDCTLCHNRVRAFSPKPGAYTYKNGVRLKILRTEVSKIQGEPGLVTWVSPQSFAIGCGKGSLIVQTVQPESKKAMQAVAYMLGNPVRVGDHFG
ncbi:MAG: methionyl-tRNA formyltransferase [Candidatus Marinimicrobia bacterium]|nr:methionyl-tRNA formyltransferase [Candidatus Neomarinimicrobiota bacterium]